MIEKQTKKTHLCSSSAHDFTQIARRSAEYDRVVLGGYLQLHLNRDLVLKKECKQ